MSRLNFENKLKIKSLVARSISEERVDQKQIINFVQPKGKSQDSTVCNALVIFHLKLGFLSILGT